MTTFNPKVLCSVDQCTHNVGGNTCMAAKIGIFNDEETASSGVSPDTLCKSFHHNKGMGDMIGAMHNINIGGAMRSQFSDGKQITPAVECYVNDCAYWSSGNLCEAREIRVAGRNAARPADTDCETFKPKH